MYFYLWLSVLPRCGETACNYRSNYIHIFNNRYVQRIKKVYVSVYQRRPYHACILLLCMGSWKHLKPCLWVLPALLVCPRLQCYQHAMFVNELIHPHSHFLLDDRVLSARLRIHVWLYKSSFHVIWNIMVCGCYLYIHYLVALQRLATWVSEQIISLGVCRSYEYRV